MLLVGLYRPQEGDIRYDGRSSPKRKMQSGRDEIYVRAFDPERAVFLPDEWIISGGAATGPHWSGNGTEIVYRSADGKVMSVEVSTQPGFAHLMPQELFTMPPQAGYWDVTPDGQMFAITVQLPEPDPDPYIVMLNWSALLN